MASAAEGPKSNFLSFTGGTIISGNVTIRRAKIKMIDQDPADPLRLAKNTKPQIKAGYMRVVDIEKLLKANGISEKVIFYGIEDIVTENIIWKIYSTIKKVTPAFVQFYKLPSLKIHGVITRIEM